VGAQGNPASFCILKATAEASIIRVLDIGEAQLPIGVSRDCLHEGVSDTHRYVEIGDSVLGGLARDELLNIGMVDT